MVRNVDLDQHCCHRVGHRFFAQLRTGPVPLSGAVLGYVRAPRTWPCVEVVPGFGLRHVLRAEADFFESLVAVRGRGASGVVVGDLVGHPNSLFEIYDWSRPRFGCEQSFLGLYFSPFPFRVFSGSQQQLLLSVLS